MSVQASAHVAPGVCRAARAACQRRASTRREALRGARPGAEYLTDGAFEWENRGALAYRNCRGALQVRNNSNRIAAPSG